MFTEMMMSASGGSSDYGIVTPKMTSNTSDIGNITVGGFASSAGTEYLLFDRDFSNQQRTFNNAAGSYAGFMFNSPVSVKYAALIGDLISFKVQAYDGTNWIDVSSNNATPFKILTDDNKYSGFRIYQTATLGAARYVWYHDIIFIGSPGID